MIIITAANAEIKQTMGHQCPCFFYIAKKGGMNMEMKYVYGPVPSRRLGLSLGISPIPKRPAIIHVYTVSWEGLTR